jgi:hypothetical protein
MNKTKVKICYLCGAEIKKEKGVNQKAYEVELELGRHTTCAREQQAILDKHQISPWLYIQAIIAGLFQLFPELEETKSVKEYSKRLRDAKEELKSVFPHLAEEEKKEERGKED